MQGSTSSEQGGRGGGRAVPGGLTVAVGAIACLGAVAYAAAPRQGADSGIERKADAAQLPRPAITQRPDEVATSTSASFGFNAGRRILRFQCRLDHRRWRGCRAPVTFTKLAAGRHAFAVRGLDGRGRHGPRARFRWLLLAPKDFSIAPSPTPLSSLYPGAPPVALPVVITNPNPVPIFVTNLQAEATADAPGCTRAEHLVLTPSTVSSSAPLRVPAGGSASLPAPGLAPPTIQLRDLPVNQDACQSARFPLAFSGKARG